MSVKEYLDRKNWKTIAELNIPKQTGKHHDFRNLNLSDKSLDLLQHFKGGIYRHQKIAIETFNDGLDVCLTTGTASGKSLVFQTCAIELLAKNPDARILAIYPLKALGSEQEGRWKQTLKKAGIAVSVGRIDGGVPVRNRTEIIEDSRVLIVTPDIIHAWLLSNMRKTAVLTFLKQMEMVVVDEAHNYKGVFGSNAAFLFRRLNHAVNQLGGKTRYIAASATLNNPKSHLKNLIGKDFHVIGKDKDSSPKNANHIMLLETPDQDILPSMANLMRFLAEDTDHRFITFMDTRKQTEYLAAITVWQHNNQAKDKSTGCRRQDEIEVYPYRAGYEEEDRQMIQGKLADGKLKGVISTSALEMGIDLPYLDLCILYGVPSSATSFFQRIGRVGRHKEGTTLIINNRSILCESIFREPSLLFNMPFNESSLYLQNKRIQYIHSLCLTKLNGELDTINSVSGREKNGSETEMDFPAGFAELCQNKKNGGIPQELQTMKSQAGNKPHYVFPLRNLGLQYQVKLQQGSVQKLLGSLSTEQLLREAYPGAIYYYQARSYRVYRINHDRRTVDVKRENKYLTKPILLPPRIIPNQTEGNVFVSARFGETNVVECNLLIQESVIGYQEQCVPNKIGHLYPLEKGPIIYEQDMFSQSYFTSGVLFYHEALNNEKVNCSLLSNILYESYLSVIPFERFDISFGHGLQKVEHQSCEKEKRFLAIHDKTYGSLRLTSRLTEAEIIRKTIAKALEIAVHDRRFRLNDETLCALRSIQFSFESDSLSDRAALNARPQSPRGDP